MDVINQRITDKSAIYNGDSIELIKQIPDNSVHYSLFSPPFLNLYTYSNSDRDLGNNRSDTEFWNHFRYLINELYRVLLPGRLISIHCVDVPAIKERDGFIGLKDFPGDIIKNFEKAGFIYHSRVTIFKDPLIEATRSHSLGLLHKQLVKDSSMCRQGLSDYLITLRKPGDNPEPIEHENGLTRYFGTDEIDKNKVYSHQVWQKYAAPVWMDINQTKTLSVVGSRDEDDEKHICPLQLDVIERCIELWSNPGDIVFDPFMGIGSVPYSAVKMNRFGLGIELKESYFKVAQKNLQKAEFESNYDVQQVSFI